MRSLRFAMRLVVAAELERLAMRCASRATERVGYRLWYITP
ncbi:MAG: hypothetical protein ACTHK7_05790 [Aureliella sp.]